jgi:hypothetical protein
MTRVQVLFLVSLVLAPLFSLLMRAVKRRLEGEAPRDLGPQPASVPAPARTPPAPAIGRGAGPRDIPRARATGEVVTSTPASGQAPSGPGARAEVRRGIVLMTILGPCRALEERPGA